MSERIDHVGKGGRIPQKGPRPSPGDIKPQKVFNLQDPSKLILTVPIHFRAGIYVVADPLFSLLLPDEDETEIRDIKQIISASTYPPDSILALEDKDKIHRMSKVFSIASEMDLPGAREVQEIYLTADAVFCKVSKVQKPCDYYRSRSDLTFGSTNDEWLLCYLWASKLRVELDYLDLVNGGEVYNAVKRAKNQHIAKIRNWVSENVGHQQHTRENAGEVLTTSLTGIRDRSRVATLINLIYLPVRKRELADLVKRRANDVKPTGQEILALQQAAGKLCEHVNGKSYLEIVEESL